jgi:hypothetical protein
VSSIPTGATFVLRGDYVRYGNSQQQRIEFSPIFVSGRAILAAKRQFYGVNQPGLNFFVLKPIVASPRLINQLGAPPLTGEVRTTANRDRIDDWRP